MEVSDFLSGFSLQHGGKGSGSRGRGWSNALTRNKSNVNHYPWCDFRFVWTYVTFKWCHAFGDKLFLSTTIVWSSWVEQGSPAIAKIREACVYPADPFRPYQAFLHRPVAKFAPSREITLKEAPHDLAKGSSCDATHPTTNRDPPRQTNPREYRKKITCYYEEIENTHTRSTLFAHVFDISCPWWVWLWCW